MRASRHRLSRFLTDEPAQGQAGFYSVSTFYREEFLRCQQCLEQQRGFYSDRAISEVQQALNRVMSQLDRLCTKADADKVVGQILRQLDMVTRLSAWSDPRQVH